MIFRPELAQKVLAGDKTVTRRLCSENPRSPWARAGGCGYRVDHVYAVQPGRGQRAIGMLRVLSVQRQRLGVLMPVAAREEGFESPAEFQAAWEQINGAYDPHAMVWRVVFEVVT